MSVLNRAILYLTRKKSRAVILLLAFFVLSVFSMIFLSISSAVSQELKSLETSLASSFTCTVNYDRFQAAQAVNEHTDFSTISDANLVTLQSLDGVAHCYTHFNPYWLIWADLDTGDEWFIKELNAEENLTPNERQNNVYLSQTLRGKCFFGCYNSDMHEYFRTGAFQLIEGRHIQPDDKYAVVISDVLAGRNDLSVGDTFTAKALERTPESLQALTESGLDNINEADRVYTTYGNLELEVVGIYKSNIYLLQTTQSFRQQQYVQHSIQ